VASPPSQPDRLEYRPAPAERARAASEVQLLGIHEHEQGVADLDLVAGRERDAAHALAVDLGAVRRLQVLDDVAALLLVVDDDRVLAADAFVEQRDVGAGIAADQGLAAAELVARALEAAGADHQSRSLLDPRGIA